MWKYPIKYDVIVVGGGHAGCEAAHASAKMGSRTLLLTMNLDTIAKMSCNPAIGGIGKGHMVREIDALGGLMGKAIDATGIQFRMLNSTKGPAVWAPRAQADKALYPIDVKHRLEKTPNLEIKQGTVKELLVENTQILGISTKEGIEYLGSSVILSSGTFMRGLMHIGEQQFPGGRAGDKPSVHLSGNLEKLGLKLGRLKTGTPPRINSRSIDFSLVEEQKGDEGVRFSFDKESCDEDGGDGEGEGDKKKEGLPQVSCYITYTTEETKKIIVDNLHLSAMYSGKIESIGPRYCPSIEDKVVRFADKLRHQVFLEPEGVNTEEVYVNGVSTSLPFDVQLAFIQSIPALRNAEITRYAYAIEYDYLTWGQIFPTLESKSISGLYFAGQLNGTTGYEETAAQGLIAGINAVNKIQGKEPFILQRYESYIGVMIDDLITKPLDEPYRMFTSRAEHRLLLRQDNADLRLREYGYKHGMVNDKQYERMLYKKEKLALEVSRFKKVFKQVNGKGYSLAQLICRPENSYQNLLELFSNDVVDYGEELNLQIEFALKYEGYIKRQNMDVEKLKNMEGKKIPTDFSYANVVGLRNEATQKLSKILPNNLGQASRISGVSPADISILMVALKKKQLLV